MSTPDPMAQFSQPQQQGPTGGPPASMQTGSNDVAASALAQIPQLEQQASEASTQQSNIAFAQADDIKQTYQQMQQQPEPQRNTKIMDMAPFFIGLVAVGGRMTGIHAKTMLAATNGMVQGMLQGSEKQFNDAQAQYEQSRKKLMDLAQLRQSYYETLYRAYGNQVNAKEKAIKASRDLVNDGFKHDMDVLKAEYQNKALEDKLFMGMQGLDLKALSIQVQQMRDANTAAHQQRQDDTAKEKVDAKVKDAKKAQSGIVNDIDALLKEMDSDKSKTGLGGMMNRGLERAKTLTGWGDQDTSASSFESRVHAMLLQIPKALTGSSRSAKDERAQVDDIANVLKMGATKPIAIAKLKELRNIITKQKYDDEAQTPQQDTGGMAPQVMQQAQDIKQKFKAGTLTAEQAQAELEKLGFGK